MKTWAYFTVVMVALGLAFPSATPAEVVGRLTQVDGRVDLLKGGKLPATSLKVGDSVEPKDVLRTKSLSKAQITFIDNSTITISPESRIAIEEYLFEPAQQKRSAVLQLFQGLAHVVVTKLFKVEDPDFVVKTHTAIMGVRGTEIGIRVHPNSSTILNFQGLTQVANIFPEVGQLFLRAFKVAYAFGSPSARNSVMLQNMQGTTVGRGMPPTLPFTITPQDQKQFMNQMGSGLTSQKSNKGSGSGTASGSSGGSTGSGGSGTGSGSGSSTASTDSGSGGTGTTGTTTASLVGSSVETFTNPGGPGSGLDTTVSSTTSTVPVVAPTGLITGTGNAGVTLVNTVTIPPEPGPATTPTPTTTTTTPAPTTPVTPTTQTYAFTQTTQSSWTDPAALTSVTVSSTGWGLRTGVATAGALALPASYGGYFTSSGTGERTVLDGALFPGNSAGVSSSTLSGTVTGVLGSTLTGTATLTGTSSFGQTTNFTGTVTIDPSGVLTFTYGGPYGTATVSSAARLASATGTNTYTPGTYFTQTMNGVMSQTSSPNFNAQTTLTNWGGTSGSGLASTYYDLIVTGAPDGTSWNYNYLPQTYSSLAGTIQGVVSPGSDGGQIGAATIIPSDRDPAFVSKLPTPPSPYLFGRGANDNTPMVSTIYIDSAGKVTGRLDTTEYQNGRYMSQYYNLEQTPRTTEATSPVASATYGFNQSYSGSLSVNNSSGASPASSLQAVGNGWGLTTGIADPAYGVLALPAPYSGSIGGNTGWFMANDQGTWNVTSGVLSGFNGYSSMIDTRRTGYGGVTQMSGRVTGFLGQTLTGPMQFYGSLLNGTSFSYNGTASINSYGELQFTYTAAGNANGPSAWTMTTPSGAVSGTASGTMWQYPGYYFEQTMGTTSGTYNLTTSTATPNSGTLALSGTGGSRSYVYGSPLGPFSSLFYLNTPEGTLPASSSGALSSPLTLAGVVTSSNQGATFGAATLDVNTSALNFSVPGQISITNGGSYFTTGFAYVPNNTPYSLNVSSFPSTSPGTFTLPTAPLAQTPLYGFTETYQGFRISTGSTPYTLANVEGYGWGTMTGASGSTVTALPTYYTGNSSTGYFVSQDLGTRASATAMGPGWAGVTGSLSGTLSGNVGTSQATAQTLSGQMIFNGINSRGTSLNYSGNATLASNGTLVWNYYGTWTNGANTGTASGTWTQVLGTYFTQTINSGTYVSSPSATIVDGTTYAIGTVKDTAPLGGTRTVGAGSPTPVTTSYAASRTSTMRTFVSSSGTPSLTVQGVVAGSDWQTKWGVASISGIGVPTPNPSTGFIPGTVTLDTTGKLTGQFVDVAPYSSGMENLTVNLVSVPTGSGQTTSSFVQTVPGTPNNVTQTVVSPTQGTLTTPTPLAGTSSGLMAGNVNVNMNLSTTAVSGTTVTPTYVTTSPGQISAQIIGAVGGPAGQAQTGVASMHSVKTAGGTTRPLTHLGTATHTPAAGSTPANLTVNLQGLNNSRSGVAAAQSGTVTVTPRP